MSQNDIDSLGTHVSYEVIIISESGQLAGSHLKSISGELIIFTVFVLLQASHLQLNLGSFFL